MIALAGGDVVLPDRVRPDASVLLAGGRVAAIEPRASLDPAGAFRIDVSGCYVVPGFIDVHVHGIEGVDALAGGAAIAEMARRLPRYGVTAFCPTTVACPPDELRSFLARVREARTRSGDRASRVLPAHLESNFINPEFAGAQPAACLRHPPPTAGVAARASRRDVSPHAPGVPVDAGAAAPAADPAYTGDDVLQVIAEARSDVGIVTLAPELPNGLELVAALASAGHLVSLGHSGADFDMAVAAIDAGARHATHLFNRMTPMSHRAPGLAGAVLARDEVCAEVICDGYHVHPAMMRMAWAAKSPRGIMAITDATAGAGLPVGASARLAGRPIRVREEAAFLEDGTLAGSTLTMDRAFRNVVNVLGLSVVDAAAACSANPARQLGLEGRGIIAVDAPADLVVLDRAFQVVLTFVEGEIVFDRR